MKNVKIVSKIRAYFGTPKTNRGLGDCSSRYGICIRKSRKIGTFIALLYTNNIMDANYK